MGVKTIIQAAVAAPYAWQTYRRWRSRSNEDRDRDGAERYQSQASYDPDLSPRRPLLMQSTSPIEAGPYSSGYTYGATAQDADDLPGYGGGAIHSSPERMRRNSTSLLHGVPEAEENEQDNDDDELPSIEEELEEEGLYKGSYSRLLYLYTQVPVTALLAWVALAVLPMVAYSSRHPSTIYPYLPYFPFPLPELLTASALWCLAYVLRAPMFAFLTYLFADSPLSWLPTVISTFLHSFMTLALCVVSFVVLQVPHATHTAHTTYRDPAFLRVWFLALGWALAEGLVAVAQGYAALASYKEVLVVVKDDEDVEASSITQSNGSNHGKAPQRQNHSPQVIRSSTSSSPLGSERRTLLNKDLQLQRRASNLSEEEILQMELDHDFDQLMAVKMRDDLEDLYGIPYIKIPVFLTSLQRINSVLLTLGVFLLSSSAYLRSPLSVPTLSPSPISSPTHDHPGYTSQWHATKSNKSLYITIPLLLFVHTALGLLHAPLILPKLGVHTVVYAGLLVSLASFCAGLGVWEALS